MYTDVKAEHINGTFDTLTTSRLVIWTTAVVERRIRKKSSSRGQLGKIPSCPSKVFFLVSSTTMGGCTKRIAKDMLRNCFSQLSFESGYNLLSLTVRGIRDVFNSSLHPGENCSIIGSFSFDYEWMAFSLMESLPTKSRRYAADKEGGPSTCSPCLVSPTTDSFMLDS